MQCAANEQLIAISQEETPGIGDRIDSTERNPQETENSVMTVLNGPSRA